MPDDRIQIEATAIVGPLTAGMNSMRASVTSSLTAIEAQIAKLDASFAAMSSQISANMTKSAVAVEAGGAAMQKSFGATVGAFQAGQAGIGAAVGGLGALFGVGIVATAIGSFINSINEATDQLEDMSAATGIATETLDRLRFVFELTNDPFEAFSRAMAKQTIAAGQATRGSKETIEAFARLGVTLNDLRTLSPDQIFLKIADKVKNTNDRTLIGVDLQKVYSRGWREIISTLELGGEQIRAKMDEANNLTAEQRKKIDEARIAWIELKNSAIPILGDIASGLGSVLKEFNEVGDAAEKAGQKLGQFLRQKTGLTIFGLPEKELKPEAQVIPFTPPPDSNDVKGAVRERLAIWREQFDLMHLIEGRFYELSKTDELAFWADKLKLTKSGTTEQLAVAKEIFNLRNGIEKQSLDEAKLLADLEKSTQETLLKLKKEGDSALLKEDARRLSGERKLAEEQADRAREAQRVADEIARTSIDLQRDRALAGINLERDSLETLEDLGTVSGRKRIEALKALATREFEIQREALVKKLELLRKDPTLNKVAIAEALADIERLQLEHNRKMKKLDLESLRERTKIFKTLFDSIQSAFSSSITGIIQGTQTLGDAVRNIFQSILLSVVNVLQQMLFQWIATHILMAIFGKSIQKETGETSITTSAAKGGAAAWASVLEAVPFPFNVALAPSVAATQVAAITALRGLLSFERGGITRQSTLAFLHPNEMVLPSPIAAAVMRMAGSGGGRSANVNFSINAMDSRGVERVLRSNRGTMVRILRQAARDGAL